MRWLVAFRESNIPCLMVPLVRTVELVRGPRIATMDYRRAHPHTVHGTDRR